MLKRWLQLVMWAAISSSPAQAVTVMDDAQQTVQVKAQVRRVVSLLPSLTETVCALGACDRLVGVDRYSNWPASVQVLPKLGGGIDPSIEAVVAQRPDLVLMAGSTRGADRLQSLGITVLRLEPRTRADAQRVMMTVATALGLPQAAAQQTWQDIQTQVDQAVQQLTAQARAQRVYVEVSPAPYGASESSFIGENLQRMGVANILPATMGPFPKVNPEYVVRAQPDVIIAGDSSRQSMLMRPAWPQLKALREDRVCVFPQAQADILVRAGPRMAEGARLMVDCLNRAASQPRKER
ncbi:MAG: Vitamin B12-binding protein precursor [Pseudomonadota bacterium]|jgi:iron complex transport system substrate-binding protein